ncbi:MAG: hypothetical protein OXF42_03620, partial [Candidatus Dadabacteria bacterium]|nr:hypothetical protein [Candidatus Dadabacteria bacterium]
KEKSFKGGAIALFATNNMPPTNTEALTTIGNLYDVLAILFEKAQTDIQSTKKKLTNTRPSTARLDSYFNLAKHYFNLLAKHYPEIDSFFKATNKKVVTSKNRGSFGGHILFRPMGLEIFTTIVATLTNKGMSLEKAVDATSKLPHNLNEPPYEGLIWDSKTKRILGTSNKVSLREILLYMLNASKWGEQELLERYRKETGDDRELPKPVVID